MERNFETVMVEQCAPVLAGLKPAGLFRYETGDCADLARRVKSWNAQLNPKGLQVRVLKGCVRTRQYLVSTGKANWRLFWHRKAYRAFSGRRATVCRKPVCRRLAICWRSFPGGCAARRIFRMRSAFFWAIRSRMWWALSKIAGRTLPVAAAGKLTATRTLPSSILPS